MAAILPALKSRLFVRSYRRLARALEGEYASRATGRSHDFDDLRDYVPGDPVRDIDWKATVRSGSPQVKRYTATRQRTLAIAIESSRDMDAVSPSGELKRDLAAAAAGVLGLLALRHGDRVVVIHGDARGESMSAPLTSERGLERALTLARDAATPTAAGADVAGLLRAADTLAREAIVAVIAGEVDTEGEWTTAIDRVAARRDVLWVEVADANPARVLAASGATDAGTGARLPRHLGSAAGLAQRFDEFQDARWEAVAGHLDGRAVSRVRLDDGDRLLSALLEMLARRPYAR